MDSLYIATNVVKLRLTYKNTLRLICLVVATYKLSTGIITTNVVKLRLTYVYTHR